MGYQSGRGESLRERAEKPSSVNFFFFFDREINADRGSLEVEPKGGTVDMLWTSASADPRRYLFFRESGEVRFIISTIMYLF